MSELMLDQNAHFAPAIWEGLSQTPKVIASRFFYDQRGSHLFEEITRLPEYYPTRTEMELLRDHGGDVVRLVGMGQTLVEFGAGSLAKTPILLDALKPRCYAPIDISAEFLEERACQLAAVYPHIAVRPIAADFTRPLHLPRFEGAVTGFFPGSTIGNFDHYAAVELLRAFKQALGEGAWLVIGIDTRKNPRLLEAAYDDAAGVTARFNLNLLQRINRELDGTMPLDGFAHRAIWNEGQGRMEMHLVAMRDMAFAVAGRRFMMRMGETIHTENSYKYSMEEARLLARAGGWEPMVHWTDAEQLFSLHVWKAAPALLQP